ncbi:MAG: tRNA pseudouridine(55) synthase TruB [Gammaproteobacteria bacterium]|nr:tRNA pseudouridine(55) synthase TruB [Gammaproteobacteria bacterium]
MGRGARRPKGFRDVDGILLLDKPCGISSNKALQKVRYLFKANKAGHTGSLDPLATGMLPICFGEATKFSTYLLDASKSYRAVCQLGQTSTTGDAEGEITLQQAVNVTRQEVEEILKRFVGLIDQKPPMHSAIKVNGQRLYKLARKGETIERQSRSIEIYSLELINLNENMLTIDVHCSKGTYIRTLAEDIGEQLGCGAFLAKLKRTGVHPFWDQPCVAMTELQSLADSSPHSLDALLLPVEAALSGLPRVIIEGAEARAIQQGQVIQADSSQPPGLIILINHEDQFIGIGEASNDGRISPKRLMNTAR